MTIDAKVAHTLLRGELVLRDGVIVGEPRGQYLSRPLQPAVPSGSA
jgi:allantoinase